MQILILFILRSSYVHLKYDAMQSLLEKDYLQLCKQFIESGLDLGDSGKWVQQDYEYLSNLIFDKTGIQLSISTLKRIWIYKTDTIPNISTLNALSRFLDYKDWYDFKRNNNERVIGTRLNLTVGGTAVEKRRKRLFFFLALSILMAVEIILILNPFPLSQNIRDISPDNIIFELGEKIVPEVPNTVIFHYDLSGTGYDSAFIQQDWDPARKVKVFSSKKYLANVYHYPGYFEASLIIGNSIVKKIPVFIRTDGWVPVIMTERFQVKPMYVDKSLITARNLHILQDDIKELGIDVTKDYFINYFNIPDLGNISSDSLTFISEIKNNESEGGSPSQYSEIILKFKHGRLLTPVCKTGYTSSLDLQYSDNYLDGSVNDFTSLGTDLSDWTNIRIEVRNRLVQVFIEGEKVFEMVYDDPMGDLVGLQYCFNGCGEVRKSEIYDSSGKLIYSDYFGNE